jgi:hypothetical protein
MKRNAIRKGRKPLPPDRKKIKWPTSFDPDLFARVSRIAHENRTSIGIVVNALLRKALGE